MQTFRDWLARSPFRVYIIAALVGGLAIGFFLASRDVPSLVLTLFAAALIAFLAAASKPASGAEDADAPYRSLVHGANYGIFRSNEKGLLYANPALARMLGYQSESEMLALDMARDIYFDPNERQRLLNLFRGQERGEGIETTWKRKDGAPLPIRLNFRVIRGLDGTRTFETIAEDLSSRRIVEEQLLHNEKLASLGRMVAGAAHEINNPLTAILGYAELLAEDSAATREQKDFAEKIKQQARRTKVITTNLQSFSSQAPGPKRQSVDINSVVTNAMRIEELNARQRKVRFEQKFAADLPAVLGDEYQLFEVCMHILNNSMDALRDMGGGAIVARTSKDGDSIIIEFADTGPGIADLARVFDPFYTTKPIGEGAGLGLSASYGIVKEHGGSIEAANRPEGGAVVIVRLPTAQSAANRVGPVTAANKNA